MGDPNESKSLLNRVLSKAKRGPVFEVALDRALPTFKRFRKSVCRANNQQGGSLIHHGQQERDQGVRVGYEVYSSHARFFVDDAKRLRGTRFFAVLPNLRPQQKKTRAHQEVLKELRRGDRVVTAGGLLGTVDKIINDGEISLEIADKVKVRVVKATVTEVLSKTQPVAETAKTAAAKVAAPKMAKPVSAKPTKAIKKVATNSAVKKMALKKPTKKSK